MARHLRTPRPYRGGKRPTGTVDLAARDVSNDTDFSREVGRPVTPHAEHPAPKPGEPGGPGRAIAIPRELDLANPSLDRTRRITRQMMDGEDPATLLKRRGISEDVAQAVAGLSKRGTVTRPNARLNGHHRNLAITFERDREALYRGAYTIKAAERVQAAMDSGKSLKQALRDESRFYRAHERARKGRLDAVTRAQRTAQRYGQKVDAPDGTTKTMLGWYVNPFLKNDPECKLAEGHNFYAEEGTIIGFPGAVHLNCGCYPGPPVQGAGMVNDAVRGVVRLGHVSKKPTYTLSRKKKTA